jgi:hypothetical protein
MTFIPSMVIFSGSDASWSFALITWLAFAVLLFTVKNFTLPLFISRQISQQQLLSAFTGYGILLFAVIIAFGGLRHFNLDMSKVYEIRREAAKDLPGIFAYLMPAFTRAILPLGMGIALLKNKFSSALVYILFGILVFAFTAHKSPFFVPFFIAFVWYIARLKSSKQLFIIFLICVVLAGVFETHLLSDVNLNTGLITSLGARRTLLVPSFLNWQYINFFENNPFVFWSESKISLGLINNPYGISVPYLIGEFLGTESHANTGWIGAGFANAGLFGVLIYSFIIGLVLKFINKYSCFLGTAFMIAVFLIPVFSMSRSADLPGMFLTHGLGFLLFFILILKFEKIGPFKQVFLLKGANISNLENGQINKKYQNKIWLIMKKNLRK